MRPAGKKIMTLILFSEPNLVCNIVWIGWCAGFYRFKQSMKLRDVITNVPLKFASLDVWDQ